MPLPPQGPTPTGAGGAPRILAGDDPTAVAMAAAALRAGGLVVLPTDTVYGLAAALTSPAALARSFAVKGRAESKTLPVLLASVADLARITAAVDPRLLALAERFWPGPLTMALPALPGLPAAVLAPDDTVGVRVPDHPVARAFLAAAGGAVAVTSANPSGQPPARTATEAVARLGTRLAATDVVLDGGMAPGGVASTVIAVDTEPRILRAGAIATATIGAAWREITRSALIPLPTSDRAR